MTGSLGDKLPEDEKQEADLCTNNHECRSIPKYVKVLFEG